MAVIHVSQHYRNALKTTTQYTAILGLQLHSTFLPDSLCEHPKGTADFYDVQGNFQFQWSTTAQGTAEIAELLHFLHLCAFDNNRWRLWGIWDLRWCRLVHGLSLAKVNYKAKMSAKSWKMTHNTLDVLMAVDGQDTVISKRNFHKEVSITFVLAWSHVEEFIIWSKLYINSLIKISEVFSK